MINVLLVDDHELVRTGIHRLLDDAKGIRVAAEASSGEQAIEYIRQTPPDVVMMDLNMPGMGGLEATRKLKKTVPTLPVIVLTVHTDDPYPSQLLKAGAAGYLHKGCSVDEMVEAINEVNKGGRYISREVAQSLAMSWVPGTDDSPIDTLSQRELQVMLMLAEGQKVSQISAQLHLSPKTVSTYRSRIISKLHVNSDAELTRLAMRYGIIKEDM